MKSERVIITILAVIVLLVLAIKEFFTIYKIEVFKDPEYLFPNGNSTLTVTVKLVNRFGIKIPFKDMKTDFDVIEGIEKVNIVEKKDDKIVFRSNYETGKVVIRIKNNYLLLPIEITIEIKGQFT